MILAQTHQVIEMRYEYFNLLIIIDNVENQLGIIECNTYIDHRGIPPYAYRTT